MNFENFEIEKYIKPKKRNFIGSFADKSKPSVDHLGNEFPSFKAMCAYWEVCRDTVYSRLRDGWSLEEALTSKKYEKYNRPPRQ